MMRWWHLSVYYVERRTCRLRGRGDETLYIRIYIIGYRIEDILYIYTICYGMSNVNDARCPVEGAQKKEDAFERSYHTCE